MKREKREGNLVALVSPVSLVSHYYSRMRAARVLLSTVLLLALTASAPAQLRVRPVGELPGDVTLKLLLRKLASTATFMETTAHPDDEDNALLAFMSHGRGMRATLVSATRGDGGQNEIGPEIFQALGVLRTEELLAVHRFDGAEQYFTRAVDFGYSFSIEESIQKWGHDEIVGDYVRHIRSIRPDVIVGFLCGGSGGGQHHQASTRLTLEAFRAAADPLRYPEQIREGLRPWQAKRVFCTEGFGAQAQGPDLLRVTATSQFDPLLGRTYSELGLEGRSMHKCQGTSQLLLLPGASPARSYRLKDSVIGEAGVAPKDMFDDIDTTVPGLAKYAGAQPPANLVIALQGIATNVEQARQAAEARGPAAAAPPLVQGLTALRSLRASLGGSSAGSSAGSKDPALQASLQLSPEARYEIEFRLAQKEPQFEEALLLTHGIRLEALADDGTVVVGQNVKVSTVAGNNGATDVTFKSVSLSGFNTQGNGSSPTGAVCTPATGAIQTGRAVSCDSTLRVGQVPVSTPYWTPRRDAARYDFEGDVPFGVPFRPSPFTAQFSLTIGGADVTIDRTIEFRYSDIVAGEKRMELQVVPAFAVRTSPDIAVVPATSAEALERAEQEELESGAEKETNERKAAVSSAASRARARTVVVAVTNNVNGPVNATASIQVPAGWTVTPASAPVKFERADEQATTSFRITPPVRVRAGEAIVQAQVSAADNTSRIGYQVVEYPHIHRRHVIEAAVTRVKMIDFRIAPGLRVGYVMGVGDEMPAAIQQLGAEVDLLDAAELASGNLGRYNVIVTGVRAYERRPDLRAHNSRLLEYVRNGGVLLVNYNKMEFNQAQYGPYPAKVGQGRVTEENAPIEVLVPKSPIFTSPNRIGPETWQGWVQERGTYFLAERDPKYVDLLRTIDPFPLNQGWKTGALVEAQYGKGRWIYLGLGLWRQLPAGTDGAYRLLANLLSLGKMPRGERARE
jgi:LmbE family N-acetylglucosaminyl deacetylase